MIAAGEGSMVATGTGPTAATPAVGWGVDGKLVVDGGGEIGSLWMMETRVLWKILGVGVFQMRAV